VYAELSPVSNRVVVLLVCGAALFGSAIGAGAVLVAVKNGPTGPAGEVGPRGPMGPMGDTEVSASDVAAAVDEDPDAVAASLSGHLDYQDIQQNLDPDPSDLASDVDDAATAANDARSTVEDLCSQLSLSDALSDDYISC
jgi:hypothetical protein